MKQHPIQYVRLFGLLDGVSLILLLFVSMPLKYWAGMPQFVTVNGMLHGGIFIVYLATIIYAQLRVRWAMRWSVFALAAAFIPFSNFFLDRQLKKMTARYPVQAFEKVWIVYLIVFFAFIDLFAQLPVMSTFALSVGATTFIAGIVVGLYSFTNTFGNIFSGVLTDRLGAFRILVLGLATTVLSLLSYQFVDSASALLVVRCIHGFTSGFITPAAFTLLANTRKAGTQGSGGAVTGSFVGVAAIVGPATSGILANKTTVPNVLALVACYGLVLIIALVFYFRGNEAREQKREKRARVEWNGGVWKAYGGAFFLMFSQGVLAFLLPLHVEALGYNSRLSGTLLSMFGIIAVLIFISPVNRLFDKIRSEWTFLFGMTVLGVSQLLIGNLTTQGALYVALACYGVGFAFLFPSINALLVESTTPASRGKAYGYFYAFFSIGVVAGSWVLGALPLSIERGFFFTGCVLLAFSSILLATFIKSKQFHPILKQER